MIKIRNEEITGQIEDLQATAENVRNTVNAIAKEGSIEPDELEIFEKEFGPKR
jgi:hypothetical protein